MIKKATLFLILFHLYWIGTMIQAANDPNGPTAFFINNKEIKLYSQ